MLEVRNGGGGWGAVDSAQPICGSYSPCNNWLSLGDLPPIHLSQIPSRFMQIVANIYESPVVQIKSEHRRAIGSKAMPTAVVRIQP